MLKTKTKKNFSHRKSESGKGSRESRLESKEIPKNLFKAAGRLKELKRSGWVKKLGMIDSESVADHSFRTSLLAAYFSLLENLDSAKATRMSLIHDLAESEIGDLMPEEKISEEEHRRLEDQVSRQIFGTLPKRPKKVFLEDWSELLLRKTKESKLVWQLDKLEMGMTMKDYMSKGGNKKKLLRFDPSENLSRKLKIFLSEYESDLKTREIQH